MANNFLPFCPTDTTTNLLTQVEYAAAPHRDIGNQPGVASSKLNNKAIRQATFVVSQLAQYMADLKGIDLLDDGDTDTLLAQMNAVFKSKDPVVQTFTSSTTYNPTYVFRIESGSANAGATYTNNGVTYTVVETIASGVVLKARGNNVPEASGVLTKAGGTGDATITFIAYTKPLYLKVTVQAGGGAGGGCAATGASQNSAGVGGAGGGCAIRTVPGSLVGVTETVTVPSAATGVSGTTGNNGGNASFGSLVVATGGAGGATQSAGSSNAGLGANTTVGVGSTGDVLVSGGPGGGTSRSSGNFIILGAGGGSYLGQGAPGGLALTVGGSGAGNAATTYGAGGSGAGNGASTSAAAGGNGGAGIVVVEEYYQ